VTLKGSKVFQDYNLRSPLGYKGLGLNVSVRSMQLELAMLQARKAFAVGSSVC
jgi:hypothetical protein